MNGELAVEAVQQQYFDLILMDIQMPVMNGINATIAIRQLKGPVSQIPIIAMTAHSLHFICHLQNYSMDVTPITIDLTYPNSVTGGDKSFEQMLLTSTVADVNIMVNNLNASWKDRDVEGIKKYAHSLISLSAIAGMPIVETWCSLPILTIFRMSKIFYGCFYRNYYRIIDSRCIQPLPGLQFY